MTNKEKYPNTDDALKAFAEHNKHCDCGATFEEWLKRDNDLSKAVKMSIAGMILGSVFGDILNEDSDKPDKSNDDKQSDDGDLTGIECPVCHGKSGKINKSLFGSNFECSDCNVYIDRSFVQTGSALMSASEAKSFIADLCKKNTPKA